MKNDTTHHDQDTRDGNVGRENVERLLGGAYAPVDADAQFARTVEAKMQAAALAGTSNDERGALLAGSFAVKPSKPSPLRRVPRRFWTAAMILISINVAGLLWIHHDVTHLPTQRLRVLTALPTGEVDETDRFSLTFDEPLVLAEAVGSSPDRPLFVIEPEPAGKWVWSARDKLEYVLDEQLRPGRVFTIRPADDVELITGRKLVGETDFRFRTRPLKLETCRLATASTTHASFELTFNQPVDPDELTRRLTALDGSTRLTLGPTILSPQVAEKFMLRCTFPPSRKLVVRLDEKLTGQGAQLALGKTIERKLDMPDRFTITNHWVRQPALKRNVTVYLNFSTEIDRSQKLPRLSVTPAVEGLSIQRNDSSFILQGPFQCGKRYTATVPGTVLARNGQTLGQDQTVSFEIPNRGPAVTFATHGGILTPKGNLTAELKAVNISGLDLSAYRVHANNLVMHLRDEDRSQTGRSVVTKSVKLDMPRNTPQTMLVDLNGLLSGPKGIYQITAHAHGHRWNESDTTIMVTDLGMTTKTYANGMEVWVTSLATARPVEGATVRAITHNNQILTEAVTDADGIARLKYSDRDPDGRPWLITAATDDGDLTYLRPNQHQWVVDNVDSSGRDHPQTYDVMLYTERGVYRPGDTIHVTGIVRDGQGRTPEAFPIEISVRRPDWREIAALTARPDDDAQGMFHLDLPTGADWQTGQYTFEATLNGASETLGTTTAQVEAFVPVRMEVHAKAAAERFGPADKRELDVSARYLWDHPAAELSVTVTGTLRSTPYASRQYADYTFRRAAAHKRISIPQVKGKLDDKGLATVELALPKNLAPDLLAGTVSASVTEPGGRSVSARASVVIDTLDVHVGLRMKAGKVVPTGKELALDWVRLTGADESAAPTAMVFALSRIEHDCTLKVVNGRRIWKSVERIIPVTRREQAPAADGTVNFTCSQPGRYRVEMSVGEKDPAAAVCEFYATDDARGPESLPMNQPERVEIVLDKPRYEPGQTAKVLIRSPLNGTMLLTMETDRVVARKVVQLTDGSAEIDLPLPADVRGGAFIAATVIRAIDPADKKWLPHRAMGLARLVTTHEAKRLDLALAAPKKALPGTTVTVTVKTPTPADPARPPVVHLWAVDEGILLTTAFKTPGPLEHFLAPRTLGVASADLYSLLMADHQRPSSMARIGAGGPDDPDGPRWSRSSPVPMRHRAPSVVWRTARRVGPDGTLRVEMPLPEMTGELRLMAVAVDGDTYARAQAPLTITAPLLVEIATPRFAAPDDTFDVPVKIFNTTDRPMSVATGIKVAGPVDIPPALPTCNVQPGRSTTLWCKARTVSMGHVDITVNARQIDATGPTHTAVAKAAFPVRPASVPHTETALLDFNAGTALAYRVPDNFLKGTARTRIEISPLPTIQLRPAIEKLLRYPYGCVEQTTSRLNAILYAPDLIAMDSPTDARAKQAADMIDAGISRLWSMQTRSGGLAYWPGGSWPNVWGTAYATAFLLEARAAGYKIDKRFTDPLVKYLEGLFNGDHHLDDNTRALICRTLAVFNRPQRGWMARLAERPDKLDIAGRAHLAMAYLAVGRRDRAWAVLPDDTLEQTVRTTSNGRLTCQTRQEAVLLSALLDLNADHAWVGRLVKDLNAARKAGAWSSTLSNAAALSALARYQTLVDQTPAKYTGTIRGSKGEAKTFDQTAATFSFGPEAGPFTLDVKGEGKVYVTATTEGLGREDLAKPYDRGLTVRRLWLDRTGKPVKPDSLKVGDLVHVEIALARPVGAAEVHNVAVVDALPAGMEVENPRLATSDTDPLFTESSRAVLAALFAASRQVGTRVVPAATPTRMVSSATPDRIEFLDDRVVLFATATNEPKVFRYALRVTSAGKFAVPPIQASCMYDPAVASLGEIGKVEISK